MASKDNVYVEFKGNKVNHKDLIDKARGIWKESGNKVKDLTTIDVYYKPEEDKSYYVLNDNKDDKMTGSF